MYKDRSQATEVKLEISCKGLRNRDLVSKSDPCAVVFLESQQPSYPGSQSYPSTSPGYEAPSGYPPTQSDPNYFANDSSGSASYHQPTNFQPSTHQNFLTTESGNVFIPSQSVPHPAPPGYPGSPQHGSPHQPYYYVAHYPPSAQSVYPSYYLAGFNPYAMGPVPQSYGQIGHQTSNSQDQFVHHQSNSHGSSSQQTQAQPNSSSQFPHQYHRYRNSAQSSPKTKSKASRTPSSSPYHVQSWYEVGRTEIRKDNLNPHFSVNITVPYRFEELQNILISIWDIDGRTHDLADHDFLGEIRTTLGDLVASGISEKRLTSPIKRDSKRNLGKIKVIVHEEHHGEKILIKGRFSAKKLARRDIFSSDPYLAFTQIGVRDASSRTHLHFTEVKEKNINPRWKPVKFKAILPKGCTYADVKFEIMCSDKDKGNRSDEIGTARCTLEQLISREPMPLIHSKKKGNFGYKNSGKLFVDEISAIRVPTIIAYLQGGMHLHFTVAIDLTASNGDVLNPSSLHYISPQQSNQYVDALTAIGSVLGKYGPPDELFSAYGFGAVLPKQSSTSSCFPLSLTSDPRCKGISGIIDAYKKTISLIQLSGPTNFSPVLQTAMKAAKEHENSEEKQNYHVLLILTDGVVSDFERTTDCIVEAANTLPLSIIIIGVGNADFGKMNAFDSDNQKLFTSDRKTFAARDIVQFVPMRDFTNQSDARLTASVLAELPNNIVDYYISKSNPITPKTLRHSRDNRI